MLKKTITFQDLDGNEITEDFYFRLTKAEIAELEVGADGGLTAYLNRIVEARDGQAIMDMFKKIIGMSVGRRSEDGRRFVKNEEITNDFMQTDAYSELFMELVTDAEKAAAFVRGLVPKDVQKVMDEGETLTEWPASDGVPPWIAEDREPTKAELQSMSREQLAAVIARKVTRE